MHVWNVLHAARWKYRTPKIAICAPSHDFLVLYLRNEGNVSTIEKKLVKQQYLHYTSSQYGELRPTNGWDPFGSLGHHSKFQRVSRLGSVTARHSSTGRHPNFAALNRGRHLYSSFTYPAGFAMTVLQLYYIIKRLGPWRRNRRGTWEYSRWQF